MPTSPLEVPFPLKLRSCVKTDDASSLVPDKQISKTQSQVSLLCTSLISVQKCLFLSRRFATGNSRALATSCCYLSFDGLGGNLPPTKIPILSRFSLKKWTQNLACYIRRSSEDLYLEKSCFTCQGSMAKIRNIFGNLHHSLTSGNTAKAPVSLPIAFPGEEKPNRRDAITHNAIPALSDLPQWRQWVAVARPCPTSAPPTERARETRTVTATGGRVRWRPRVNDVHRRAICRSSMQTRHI